MAIKTKHFGTMEYLIAEGISASHGFTTRLGGVSTGYLSSLNIGAHRGDLPKNVEKNYQILADALGFDLKATVLTHQIHTDIVRAVTKADANGLDNRDYPECDALITNDPGTALVIFTADCTPVLLHDPITGAVGAAHAGWRGTAAKIAGKTVEKMVAAFGCRPEDIRAAIGPNIGPCCFETDSDVPEAILSAYGAAAKNWIQQKENKYYVNLKAINALALQEVGVTHIEISEHCTACECNRFWSHRITGDRRGSQGAVIVCGEGRK